MSERLAENVIVWNSVEGTSARSVMICKHSQAHIWVWFLANVSSRVPISAALAGLRRASSDFTLFTISSTFKESHVELKCTSFSKDSLQHQSHHGIQGSMLRRRSPRARRTSLQHNVPQEGHAPQEEHESSKISIAM
jgi:hypothetical protein